MQGVKKAWGNRKVWVGIAMVCTVAALAAGVTIATGTDGGPDSPEGASKSSSGGERSPASTWVSTHERVLRHEALPCTGAKEPVNFETFTAGPAVAGLPMTSSTRRCDSGAPAGQSPSNEVNYSYGSCKIPRGATGCQPPLAIQTWPACQRSLADYSYDGKPMPYRELPKLGSAEVVEIELPLEHRIEVYTKSATVVIFATDPKLALRALGLLRARRSGMSLAAQAAELKGKPANSLAPPSDGAVEGVLSCHT